MEIKTVKEMHGESNGKPWTRYEFEMSDLKKYSTFNRDLYDNFKAGDNVEVQGHQEGKYFKLDGFIKVEKMENTTNTANTANTANTTNTMPKTKAMRGATEITATELLRYSIKLFDSHSCEKGFVECQELVFEAYKNFLGRL